MRTYRLLSTTPVFGLAVFLLATPAAEATVIAEIEPNNTLATAQNINGFFSLDFSPDIGNQAGTNTSTTMPHVTILGTGNGTFDYYSFTVTTGGLAIFDIDFGCSSSENCQGAPGSGGMDTEIAVWTAAGILLASNDDFAITAGAGGSVHPFDSFIQLTLAPGTYVVGVAEFNATAVAGGWSAGSNVPDTGDTYTLQVSVVPEPATLALMGAGLLGLGLSRRRNG